MLQLSSLIEQSRADIVLTSRIAENESTREVSRVMQICNACRYCEGFCAVFPAMTRRLEFSASDAHYLANLCHNCGACFHACQYAPPHEFGVNVPQALAKARVTSYTDFAWPTVCGALYRRSGLTLSLALAASLGLFLWIAVVLGPGKGGLWHQPMAGNFYAIFPHNFLAILFGSVFLLAVLCLAVGIARFWRETNAIADQQVVSAPSAREALHSTLSLKYLDGGHGDGCHDANDQPTHWRRRFHHLTFYGFGLCFASTSIATFYHYVLKLPAPYAFTSIPVVLGTLGGLGLLIGPVGLFWLKQSRPAALTDDSQNAMDYGFIALLFLTSVTGLLLMIFRNTGALASLLAVHLGVVMALFVTMPYSKFAHGFYRAAALLKWSIEKRLPTRLKLGD